MNFIVVAVIVLGAIGLVAASVLFVCSKKFAVKEDPRLAEVAALLPQANCGGCGFPGCSGLADALVKGADAGSIDGLGCPVGGHEVMDKVADLLGMAIANTEPKVAVVRCNGTCGNRPKVAEYSGLRTCAAMHACGAGESACGYGCLGCGDCLSVCSLDAIHVNPETGIVEVDEVSGEVTAVSSGSAYVTASLTLGGRTYSARCRVDVIGEDTITSVQLSTKTPAVELYKTNYTTFTAIPLNEGKEAVNSPVVSVDFDPKNSNYDILNTLFRFEALDSRTVQIVPRQEAIENAYKACND